MVREIHKLSNHKPTIVVFSGTIANATRGPRTDQSGRGGLRQRVHGGAAHPAVAVAAPLSRSLQPPQQPAGHARHPGGLPCRQPISSAVTLNISQGGLAIRTTSPLEVGTKLRVRFRLSTSRFDLESEARVAWSVPRLGMGVEFVKLDHESQAAIHAFVQAHFFSNRKA